MGVSACHARRSLCKSVDAGDGALVRRVARVLSCSVGSTTSKDLPSHAHTHTRTHTDTQTYRHAHTNTLCKGLLPPTRVTACINTIAGEMIGECDLI